MSFGMGTRLVIPESMKMENELRAPCDGVGDPRLCVSGEWLETDPRRWSGLARGEDAPDEDTAAKAPK